MTPANSGLTAILCCVLIGFTGCGQSDKANPLMSDNDTLLNELLGSVEEDQEETIALTEAEEESGSPAIAAESGLQIPSTEDDTSDSIVDDILGGRTDQSDTVTTALLDHSGIGQTAADFGTNVSTTKPNSVMQLKAGDQFPFLKTIRQTVVQTSASQTTSGQVTAQTLMQLTMNLSVLESSATGHVFHVRYDRVQYSQDINGRRQSFDSAARHSMGQLANSVPAGIESYAGMVGNGFRFTLTPQNKVAGIEGLSNFLDQCVSAAPFDQRVNIRSALEQRFQSGAIAELVDESIGLLPYGSSVAQPGDVWMTDRRLQHQSPVQMQTTCRMISTSSDAAEIGLTGRIESVAGSTLKISNGRTMGTCLVDLSTGMPLHCHRSSYLKMSTQQSPDQTIEITKRIESTFTSQSQSAKLLVQRHGMTSPSDTSEAMATNRAFEGAGNSMPQTFAGSQSALLPGNNYPTLPQGQSSYSDPSLQVQPVSSANPFDGSLAGNRGQIPSGQFGGVPAEDLQSTVEAVYPD